MSTTSLRSGMLYMLLASFCFVLTGACAKWLSPEISSIELVLYRNIIGVLFILVSLYTNPPHQEGGKLGLLIFRGVIGTISLYTFFYGIATIGLSVSITYQQAQPIFLTIFSAIIFKEYLTKKESLGVLLGFAGILLIFLPSVLESLALLRNHFIGLSNAIMASMAYLSIRQLSHVYDVRIIVLSFMLSGIILPMISLLIGSYVDIPALDFLITSPSESNYNHILPIIILGISALVGQVYLTKAYSYEKSGLIASVGYSNIIFSIFFGVILGDPIPSKLGFLGITLIIICGIILATIGKKKSQNKNLLLKQIL